MVFVRQHTELQQLTTSERAILLARAQDIFLKVVIDSANYMRIFGNVDGEKEYRLYLERAGNTRELQDVAELRRVLDIFVRFPSRDAAFDISVVSKMIDLSDALGMYDQQLFTALSAKYRYIARAENIAELGDALKSTSTLKGFALGTTNVDFFRSMYEENIDRQVVNLVYELLLVLQIGDQDAELLAGCFQALEKIVKIIQSEESTQLAEESTFAGSMGIFEGHFTHIQTVVAERFVDVSVMGKKQQLSSTTQLYQVGRMLASLPVYRNERQERSSELTEARLDLAVEEVTAIEQLFRTYKGMIIVALESWGQLTEAARSSYNLVEYFTFACERRLQEAKRQDHSRGLGRHRKTSARSPLYTTELVLTSPFRLWPAGSLSPRQLSDIQYTAWTLSQNAPDAVLTPEQRLGLLAVSEAALRSLVAISFNFSQLDILVAKTMPTREALLRNAGEVVAADQLKQEITELLRSCLISEVWDQDINTAGGQVITEVPTGVLFREWRGRDHLLGEIRRVQDSLQADPTRLDALLVKVSQLATELRTRSKSV